MVDKDRIQRIAEELSYKEHNCEFYELPEDARAKVYAEAMESQADREADRADIMRKLILVERGGLK